MGSIGDFFARFVENYRSYGSKGYNNTFSEGSYSSPNWNIGIWSFSGGDLFTNFIKASIWQVNAGNGWASSIGGVNNGSWNISQMLGWNPGHTSGGTTPKAEKTAEEKAYEKKYGALYNILNKTYAKASKPDSNEADSNVADTINEAFVEYRKSDKTPKEKYDILKALYEKEAVKKYVSKYYADLVTETIMFDSSKNANLNKVLYESGADAVSRKEETVTDNLQKYLNNINKGDVNFEKQKDFSGYSEENVLAFISTYQSEKQYSSTTVIEDLFNAYKKATATETKKLLEGIIKKLQMDLVSRAEQDDVNENEAIAKYKDALEDAPLRSPETFKRAFNNLYVALRLASANYIAKIMNDRYGDELGKLITNDIAEDTIKDLKKEGLESVVNNMNLDDTEEETDLIKRFEANAASQGYTKVTSNNIPKIIEKIGSDASKYRDDIAYVKNKIPYLYNKEKQVFEAITGLEIENGTVTVKGQVGAGEEIDVNKIEKAKYSKFKDFASKISKDSDNIKNMLQEDIPWYVSPFSPASIYYLETKPESMKDNSRSQLVHNKLKDKVYDIAKSVLGESSELLEISENLFEEAWYQASIDTTGDKSRYEALDKKGVKVFIDNVINKYTKAITAIAEDPSKIKAFEKLHNPNSSESLIEGISLANSDSTLKLKHDKDGIIHDDSGFQVTLAKGASKDFTDMVNAMLANVKEQYNGLISADKLETIFDNALNALFKKHWKAEVTGEDVTKWLAQYVNLEIYKQLFIG